jgi:DNA repair protein RadA/Sms
MSAATAFVPGYPCKTPGCGATVPQDKSRCPKCKTWHIPDLVPGGDDEETVLLSDARVSQIVRLETGMLDDVFGGGLAETSVNLVAGPPGAGKTTLFLQLASICAELRQREVLYIANEQTPDEIKTTAERIQIPNIRMIRVVKAMGGLKSPLGDLIMRYKPCLMILDSLTKLTGDDPNLAIRVCEALKTYTVELRAPSLIVNQINKDGDHAGLMKIQHAVDATFFLEKDDTSGERYFYSTKNRFGESPKAIELLMTSADTEIPGMLMPKPNKAERDVSRLLGDGEESEDDG